MPKDKLKLSAKYYVPVWPGLFRDSSGKHYRRMGKSVWLYLNLLYSAHQNELISKIKYGTLSRNTGIPRSTVIKQMHRLKQKKYITMETVEGRYLRIKILKWKTQAQKQHQHQERWLKQETGNTELPKTETQ
ncbi:MAG: hypothetical protein KBC02_03085 [Candidatus Pacebacteria bacterium]|nr:hypothetical protein [Candidatus Paceibacterota bacterium]